MASVSLARRIFSFLPLHNACVHFSQVFYTPANAGRIPLGLLTNSAALLLTGMWPLTTFNTIILEPVSDSVVIHQYTQLCRPLLLLSRQQLKHDCVILTVGGKVERMDTMTAEFGDSYFNVDEGLSWPFLPLPALNAGMCLTIGYNKWWGWWDVYGALCINSSVLYTSSLALLTCGWQFVVSFESHQHGFNNYTVYIPFDGAESSPGEHF
jgi:hypothetical protein